VPAAIPYARLSAFYFWYYGLLGLLHPFWPLFLSHQQFSAREIGQLLAIQIATRIVSPNLWGWLADHSGQRMATIRLGAALGFVFYAGIFWVEGFWGMALVMAGYSFFWNGVMPQFEALTLDHLHHQPQRYSSVRVWGSIGFIVTVVCGGFLFEESIGRFPAAGLLFLGMILLASLWAPAVARTFVRPVKGAFWRLLCQRQVLTFLLMSFLLQVSHGIYYAFYSLQLEAAGYSRSTIGLFWALSVLAEIILFMVMRRLMTNWSLRGILLVSLLLTALRWLMIGHFTDLLALLLVAQCLHAFSFGACHAVSVEYLRRFFPREHLGQGQAIYSSASFGAGGAIGALLGGLLWSQASSWTFDVAVLVTLAALLVAFLFIDRGNPRE